MLAVNPPLFVDHCRDRRHCRWAWCRQLETETTKPARAGRAAARCNVRKRRPLERGLRGRGLAHARRSMLLLCSRPRRACRGSTCTSGSRSGEPLPLPAGTASWHRWAFTTTGVGVSPVLLLPERRSGHGWVPIRYAEVHGAIRSIQRLLAGVPKHYARVPFNDLQGLASCGCGNLQCRWATDYGVPSTGTKLTWCTLLSPKSESTPGQGNHPRLDNGV